MSQKNNRKIAGAMKMELITLLKISPPIIAIVLMLITKKPVISLASGVLAGTLVITGINLQFFTVLVTNSVDIITDVWNIKLMITLLLLGAFIGIIEAALHKKELLSNFFNSRKKVLFTGWLMGLLLFIDDYFNILLNGLFLRSFARKHRISKEKIAFVIHSLGVSACVLIPFSTWTIFIISIVNNLDIGIEGFNLFIRSIPFNFYSIALIFTTLAVILFEIDVLRMKKAETNIILTKKRKPHKGKMQLKEFLIPTGVLIAGSLFIVLASMGFNISIAALESIDFISVLLISSTASIAFAFIYYAKKKTAKKRAMITSMYRGASHMNIVILILFFAWMLGTTTEQAGTTDVIIGFAQQYINPTFITLIAFIITATIAFMTSSWATFAIMIPVFIPLAVAMQVNPAFVLAAIISGGVFGDHMSPISSTSILTKAVSRSEVTEHFHSQLPYSVIAVAMSAYLFFLIMRI
jgi:Na+/H+ antiporter NhaC